MEYSIDLGIAQRLARARYLTKPVKRDLYWRTSALFKRI